MSDACGPWILVWHSEQTLGRKVSIVGGSFVWRWEPQTEGRCYELAVRSILEDNPNCLLAVGKYYGFLGHAWVMQGGRVYDPAQHEEMEWDEYRTLRHAEIFRCYTADAVRRWLVQSGHYPPWEDVEEYHHFVMGDPAGDHFERFF